MWWTTIGDNLSGTIDEIRIAAVEHTAAWEAAQYASMTDQVLTLSEP